MIDLYDKKLNCTETLRDKWPVLIDTFVDFYGEDRRKEIEEKFSKALPIAYLSIKDKKSYLSKIDAEISSNMFNAMLKNEVSNFTYKDLLGTCTLKNPKHSIIDRFDTFYNLHCLGAEGRKTLYKKEGLENIQIYIPAFTASEYDEMVETRELPSKYEKANTVLRNYLLDCSDISKADDTYKRAFKLISSFISKIDPNITLDNFDSYVQNNEIKTLIKYTQIFPALLTEYNEIMKKYKTIQEEVDLAAVNEEKYQTEYYYKLIESNRDLLKEEDLKLFDSVKGELKTHKLNKNITSVFGSGLDSSAGILSFSEENNEKLADSDASSWVKESITNERISYFKARGIDLGDKYEDYVNSPEAKTVWPSNERISNFQSMKDRLKSESNDAFYSSLPSYIETKKEVDALNLLGPTSGYETRIFKDAIGPTYVCPNIVKKDNGYELFSTVVINSGLNVEDGVVDHHIIHEFNHLFELHLNKVDDSACDILCGWDDLHLKMQRCENDENEENTRSHELFNEVINEIITQEIYTKMLEKDRHVFDTKEYAKARRLTSYDNYIFLVKDFYKEFKDDIIASRSDGRIDIIFDKVGKENFEDLNQLIKACGQNFSGFKYLHLINDLRNKKETENTKKFNDLIQKRDAILEKMQRYSLEHSIDNSKISK